MEQENNVKKEKKELTFKEKMKKAIFNRFYLELIAYLIIIMLGLFLSASMYATDLSNYENFNIIAGVGVTIVVFVMLYILGYLSARKKEASNKYLSCFGIYVILFVIYILSTLFYKENSNNFFLIDFLNRIKQVILLIHSYIFNWINILGGKELPNELYVLVTPFIMYLGCRKNRKVEIKRIKKKKMMERRKYNG